MEADSICLTSEEAILIQQALAAAKYQMQVKNQLLEITVKNDIDTARKVLKNAPMLGRLYWHCA